MHKHKILSVFCAVIQLLLLFFKIIICRNDLKSLSPEETRMQQNSVFSRKANLLDTCLRVIIYIFFPQFTLLKK